MLFYKVERVKKIRVCVCVCVYFASEASSPYGTDGMRRARRAECSVQTGVDAGDALRSRRTRARSEGRAASRGRDDDAPPAPDACARTCAERAPDARVVRRHVEARQVCEHERERDVRPSGRDDADARVHREAPTASELVGQVDDAGDDEGQRRRRPRRERKGVRREKGRRARPCVRHAVRGDDPHRRCERRRSGEGRHWRHAAATTEGCVCVCVRGVISPPPYTTQKRQTDGMATNARDFANDLHVHGAVVIPVMDEESRRWWEQSLYETFDTFPEYRVRGRAVQRVLGGFGAYGNPSSFHDPVIRQFRRKMKGSRFVRCSRVCRDPLCPRRGERATGRTPRGIVRSCVRSHGGVPATHGRVLASRHLRLQ